MFVIALIINMLNYKTAHASGFRSPLRVRGEVGIN